MSFVIRPVQSRRDLRKFIFVPERIHKRHAQWLPPIFNDEWRYFDPKKNRSFSYCDTTLALAIHGGQTVGRIMGIINRRVNEKLGEKNARFGYLETYEDEATCHRLLAYIEDWARQRGMTKIVGPMGFTDQDPEGFLIEGFRELPTLATYCNFEFMVRFMERAGFTKEIDYVDYAVPVPTEVPPLYQRISERILKRGEFALREFTNRKEIKPFIRPVLSVMNETFRDLYGYSPLDEQEMDALAAQYLPMIDPRFVKVVTRGSEVVAFFLGMPNMTPGIRKARGRLYPFGILMILSSARRAKQLDLLLGGIEAEYRDKGLDALMGAAMLRSAFQGGFKLMDSHHEMETNYKMRAEMERAGGKIVKRLRIYQKPL